jgi:hypothetical protein
MISKRLYPLIKQLLIECPELRNSDKKLLWRVWQREGKVIANQLSYEAFLSTSLTSAETITRCRRKIQELNPELQSNKVVQQLRQEKQKTKGTWIYRENIAVWREL